MKILRIGIIALMALAGGGVSAVAQDQPAPAGEGQPTTPPNDQGQPGKAPDDSGSTGWTGGTGGARVGGEPKGSAEDKNAAKSQTAPGQPDVVEGANPNPRQ